jgi:hypothetical protein
MGGTCSVPVKQVYGVHAGTSDVMEKQTNHVFVEGSSEPVEKEEMVRRLTFTFRGEDGRTYTATRYLTQDESDTYTPRLQGRLKLYPYLKSTNRTEIYEFMSASAPGHPPDIWKDSDGRLMTNKGRPVCDDAKKPNFLADNFHAINILACILSLGAVVVIGMTAGPMVASSASSASAVAVLVIYLTMFMFLFSSL